MAAIFVTKSPLSDGHVFLKNEKGKI